MEIDKREQEQREWKGYGSAERPVVVPDYHSEAVSTTFFVAFTGCVEE